jgi:anti-sigma-K factor RskA
MTAPGPDHARWTEDVGAYLLGALEPGEREGFEGHLAHCPVCRGEVEDLRVAAEALPVSVPLVKPPEELKQRIMTVVRSEAELLAAAGSRADAPAGAASVRSPRARRRWSLGTWLSRPAVALGCALVLLAVGGLGGALLSGGGGTRTLVAQTTAPGAQVRLEIDEDGTSQLVARNMPAPPRGRLYQVWLKRPGRDPQPTSVLWSTRSDGSAEVAVPGSLDGVEAVLVTDEPEGGSDVPSKAPVITAVPA